MNIERLSTDLSQARVMDQVQTSLLAKSLDMARSQGGDLEKLLDGSSAQAQPVVRDPALGNRIDLLA